MQEALKFGRIHVVNENWFNHSVALWRRQKEKNFPVPLDDQPPASSQPDSKAKKKAADTTLEKLTSSTGTSNTADTSAIAVDKPDASTSRITDKVEDTAANNLLPTTPQGDKVDITTEATGTTPLDALSASNPETGADRTTSTIPESRSNMIGAGIATMNGRMSDVKAEFAQTQSIGDDMLETINWASVDEEVDEAMRDSDDEYDTRSQRSAMGSDDGWTSENR